MEIVLRDATSSGPNLQQGYYSIVSWIFANIIQIWILLNSWSGVRHQSLSSGVNELLLGLGSYSIRLVIRSDLIYSIFIVDSDFKEWDYGVQNF